MREIELICDKHKQYKKETFMSPCRGRCHLCKQKGHYANKCPLRKGAKEEEDANNICVGATFLKDNEEKVMTEDDSLVSL